MSEREEDQGPAGDTTPQPIGEIASMIERTPPPAPIPAAPGGLEIAPIGEIESALERSPKPA